MQGWTRRLIGKPPKEEKMLLHTLPYYLAISRSSCEVDVVLIFCSVKEMNRLSIMPLNLFYKSPGLHNNVCVLKAGLPGTCYQPSDRQ